MSPSSFGFKKVLALSVLALAGVAAQAQVVISFNVTPQSGQIGYNAGNNYTFSVTTGASFLTGSSNLFFPGANQWGEEFTTDDQLFTTVTGDGLLGSFARPVSTSADANSYLFMLSNPGSDSLFVLASADDSNIGLTTVVGALAVRGISANLGVSGATFSYPGVYSQPNGILAAAAGTYFPTAGSFTLETSEGDFPFNVNSFTIGPAVSEVPFGVDSTTGLALLGLASAWKLRRRNRS